MKSPPVTSRRGVSKFGVTVGVVITCLLLFCMGCVLPIELVVLLCFGWIGFLWRVIPEMTFDLPAVSLGIAALAAFVAGTHALLRSWWRQRNVDINVDTPATPGHDWPLRHTLAVTMITLLLFVAAISMVGITHQLVWLSQTDDFFDLSRQWTRPFMSQNNLKYLALGTLDYHDENGALPFSHGRPPSVKPLHGWQTAILPYAELGPVYKIIDLSEPWNAKANHEAMTTYVPTFANPGINFKDDKSTDWPNYGPSHYAANRHFLGPDAPRTCDDVTDGTSQTILAGEVASNFRPWGHPANYRDPALGINTSPDGFGSPWSDGDVHMIFADGSVHRLNRDVDPNVLRALATPNGGEDVPDRINGDW